MTTNKCKSGFDDLTVFATTERALEIIRDHADNGAAADPSIMTDRRCGVVKSKNP